ncbi:MAG TPA: hypothetical protein VFT98_03615 [Myxococcota bacterium]|nr:hypothetical protein [Myxococcota bacterium]
MRGRRSLLFVGQLTVLEDGTRVTELLVIEPQRPSPPSVDVELVARPTVRKAAPLRLVRGKAA